MNQQRRMLIESRDQFAQYAQAHRMKASRYTAEKLGCSDEVHCTHLQSLINEATDKAIVNEDMVKQIQATLAEPADVLTRTAEFGQIAYADGISPKNQQTQIGVHFEEVAEMIDTIGGHDSLTSKLLNSAQKELIALADHLKNSEPGQYYISDRTEFLDSVADQIVTATLSGVLHGMRVVEALKEVNRSNFSKLTDGKMAKDPVTAKWIKGPNYSAPNLRRLT